ncbi:MAG: rhombosortase [Candidatus Muproteobacteria bacterium RBG_19FT_COMBO_61_10]|uniref:Rhombosortase n=1 Tax=Candidatus Muproteobacteria bacterium RBG_19FT_COMBO_61_10 TaxID=1817761 RepID=A0A1F6UGV8_9PROT|nr:MAG: rhombosortase [Candidatus Muproteobacteria bacterium RBG_19FT_COMBO_61_10]
MDGRGSFWLPRFTLLLMAISIGLYIILGPAPASLVFDRAAIVQGEWWRLYTGHLVHSDARHALWNILALGVLAGLLERRGRRRLGLIVAFGAVGVDLWLWWGQPALQWYCGLSGLLNTLLVVVLFDLWSETRRRVVLAIGMALAAKLVLEIVLNQALFTHTLWPSVPWVHVAGFAAGWAFVVLERRSCPAVVSARKATQA